MSTKIEVVDINKFKMEDTIMYQDDNFATGYAVGRDSANGCYGNNGLFGNSGWEGIIGLIVVAGLFGGGWGGFGFGGNRGGSPATQADLSAGFANSEIMSDLNDIILGQASMQNFINQGFAGLNNTITTGFAGVNNAVCTLGYQNQAGFNSLASQIASCCCDLKTINLENRYLNEKQTCDIIRATENNTKAILDFLTTEKISSLQAENSGLKAQISNDRQSAYIIDALAPKCPQPAYVVQPAQPVTFPTNCCGNVAYANFGTCGASVL